MTILERITSIQGRLTTGFALVVAIVIGLWPDHDRPVDPVLVGAVVTAALAWLFAEIGGEKKAPSAHDLKLFQEINNALPQAELDFLIDQHFGDGSFQAPASDGIGIIAFWQGARFEFVDQALNEKWEATRNSIKKFSSLYALNTFVFHDEVKWRTVHPTHGDPENPETFVQERIDKLNTSATELYNEVNEFERYARRRLGL